MSTVKKKGLKHTPDSSSSPQNVMTHETKQSAPSSDIFRVKKVNPLETNHPQEILDCFRSEKIETIEAMLDPMRAAYINYCVKLIPRRVLSEKEESFAKDRFLIISLAINIVSSIEKNPHYQTLQQEAKNKLILRAKNIMEDLIKHTLMVPWIRVKTEFDYESIPLIYTTKDLLQSNDEEKNELRNILVQALPKSHDSYYINGYFLFEEPRQPHQLKLYHLNCSKTDKMEQVDFGINKPFFDVEEVQCPSTLYTLNQWKADIIQFFTKNNKNQEHDQILSVMNRLDKAALPTTILLDQDMTRVIKENFITIRYLVSFPACSYIFPSIYSNLPKDSMMPLNIDDSDLPMALLQLDRESSSGRDPHALFSLMKILSSEGSEQLQEELIEVLRCDSKKTSFYETKISIGIVLVLFETLSATLSQTTSIQQLELDEQHHIVISYLRKIFKDYLEYYKNRTNFKEEHQIGKDSINWAYYWIVSQPERTDFVSEGTLKRFEEEYALYMKRPHEQRITQVQMLRSLTETPTGDNQAIIIPLTTISLNDITPKSGVEPTVSEAYVIETLATENPIEQEANQIVLELVDNILVEMDKKAYTPDQQSVFGLDMETESVSSNMECSDLEEDPAAVDKVVRDKSGIVHSESDLYRIFQIEVKRNTKVTKQPHKISPIVDESALEYELYVKDAQLLTSENEILQAFQYYLDCLREKQKSFSKAKQGSTEKVVFDTISKFIFNFNMIALQHSPEKNVTTALRKQAYMDFYKAVHCENFASKLNQYRGSLRAIVDTVIGMINAITRLLVSMIQPFKKSPLPVNRYTLFMPSAAKIAEDLQMVVAEKERMIQCN